MALHSLRAASEYRSAPSARQLFERFPAPRPGSTRSLLTRTGPFTATVNPSYSADQRDGFRFTNAGGWIMSDHDAQVLGDRAAQGIRRAQGAVLTPLREALDAISVEIPIAGSVGLPRDAIEQVMESVTGDVIAFLVALGSDVSPKNYGRCGGMAFAAIDYFLAGVDVPVDAVGQPGATPEDQPASGPLHDFVWTRLLDSLDKNLDAHVSTVALVHVLPEAGRLATAALGLAVGNMAGPMAGAVGALIGHESDIFHLGGPSAVRDQTKEHVGRLREKLEAFPAWPIGLVYGDKPFLWQQHQILALRFVSHDDEGATLLVYDVNAPKRDISWRITWSGSEIEIPGETVKAIICEEYGPADPPP